MCADRYEVVPMERGSHDPEGWARGSRRTVRGDAASSRGTDENPGQARRLAGFADTPIFTGPASD